jgi:hypothetical protein
MAETTGQDFRVGRVLGTAWSVYAKNIVPFSAIALALLLPLLAIRLLSHLYLPLLAPWDPTTRIGGAASWFPIIMHFVSNVLLIQLVTATLVYGTIKDMRHQSVSIREALTQGLRLALRALGVVMVSSVLVGPGATMLIVPGFVLFEVFWVVMVSFNAVGLGVIMLVLPGLMLFVVLWVVIPVAVVERLGIIASLRRSVFLTKGNRWRITGLVAVLLLISILISTLPELIVGTGITWRAYAYIDYALAALVTAVSAVVITVSYHDLRLLKEGVDVEGIAAVFD